MSPFAIFNEMKSNCEFVTKYSYLQSSSEKTLQTGSVILVQTALSTVEQSGFISVWHCFSMTVSHSVSSTISHLYEFQNKNFNIFIMRFCRQHWGCLVLIGNSVNFDKYLCRYLYIYFCTGVKCRCASNRNCANIMSNI